MKLKIILKRLFTFDEFMKGYLIIFSILYIMAIFKFLYFIDSIKGFVQYIALMVSSLISIILFLHVIQVICRLIGMDKLYTNLKQTIKDRNKKN